jgi:hypothetical protein
MARNTIFFRVFAASLLTMTLLVALLLPLWSWPGPGATPADRDWRTDGYGIGGRSEVADARASSLDAVPAAAR